MPKLFAELVVGNTYSVGGVRFVKNEEREIHQDLYDYLETNTQFNLRAADESADTGKGTADAGKTSENPPSVDEKPLADWKRPALEAEAKRLHIKGITDLDKPALVEAIEDARALAAGE